MTTPQEYTPEATHLEKLAPGVYALIGGGTASNSAFIISECGVMVIDASMTPSVASHLLSHIENISDKPILHLVNTHYHGDHTFGNQVFSPISIVSHANCRDELISFGEDFKARAKSMRPYLADEINKIEVTYPSMTYTNRLTFYYGDKVIEVMHLGVAHTRGDSLVYLPQDKVLFAGDLVFHEIVPFAGEGYVSNWIRVMDNLDAMDINVVVPGHGEVCTRKGLRQAREYLVLLRDEVQSCFASGLERRQAEEQARVNKYEHWPAQERNKANVARLYQEIGGELGL